MTHQANTLMINEEETTAPILNVIDGRILVTSLKVAWDFKKSHKNVLRDIDAIVEECPGEFSRLNFEPREYKDERGKLQPIYDLTRDGFALLAMGFNGAKALAFKLAYLTEFNRMEQSLLALQNGTAAATPRLNDATVQWLKDVCGQSEEQIASFGNAVYGCLQNFKISMFTESGNKQIQDNFLKSHTQLLLQASATGQFEGGDPERNYLRLMGILSGLVEQEMAKVNRGTVAMLGRPVF